MRYKDILMPFARPVVARRGVARPLLPKDREGGDRGDRKGQPDMLQSAAAVGHPYGSGRPDFAGLEPTMKLFSGGEGGAAASGFARARRSLNRLISTVMAVVIVLTVGGLWLRYHDASRDAARNARNM